MSNPLDVSVSMAASGSAPSAGAASAASASASTQTMPPLPAVAPNPNPSSPRRMLRAVGNGINAIVTTMTSPFRRPLEHINTSPGTSVDVSEMTGPPSPEKEAETAIRVQAFLDYNQRGDGGDSDEDGAEANLHNEGVSNVLFAHGVDRIAGAAMDGDQDLDYEDEGEEMHLTNIPGAPTGWQPPGPPDSFSGYTPKANSGAPLTFDAVDNPAGWCDYAFAARYNRQGKYTGHFTPCGASVVPKNAQDKREIDGWEFFYNGWEADEFARSTYVRGEAGSIDINPDTRVGVLDIDLLTRFGINKETKDSPIHWYTLLFPICDPAKSGVDGDGRMPYYSNAAAWTNIYAYAHKGWGSGYSHKFDQVTETELVRWAGIPIRHGARDGRPGTLHHRWMPSDPDYDSLIADSMTASRYRQLKAVFKLNNNMVEPSRGQPGYDPCSRYDYIFKTLCHNMNYFTKTADMDFAIDESTWGFGGYMAECGGRLKNKPFNKGGQTVMVFDIRYRFPRAYHHRHKVHVRPTGFGQEGPSEMHGLLTQVESMIAGNSESVVKFYSPSGKMESLPVKQIYPSYPHGTADNHFSGDHVLDFAGGKGFGLTLTCRRDRFPSGLKSYMHSEKVTESTGQRSKVMRYQNPITAVKQVPSTDSSKNYTKTHVSFQSTGTGPTNICGVNNLNCVKLYVSKKERGIGAEKRVWAIEMNEARSTYLNTYYGIDNVDHMIKNACMRMISWKYWHAPYHHAHAMGVIAAYDMYQQACDGLLDPDWALSDSQRMSFRDFRLQLSEQMLRYTPSDGLLPGDENFRVVTQRHTNRRKDTNKKRKSDSISYGEEGVTPSNYKCAKTDPCSRLCGDLDEFLGHTVTFSRQTNASPCEVCNAKCRWKCQKCNKFMCVLDKKSFTGGSCMIRFHSDTFFGLPRCDAEMNGTQVWKAANENRVRRHAAFMKKLMEDLKQDEIDLNNIPSTSV